MRTMQAVVAAAALGLSAAAQAAVIWRGDFETGDISQWSKAQEVSPDRLQVVQNPVVQGKYALKATVVQGDNPIGASGNRNELVYLSYEPSGTERYYRWQTMFDSSYPSENTWQLFTQWHHTGSNGSPPVEFDIYGEEITMVVNWKVVWRAPLVRGVWHDFIFHVKWQNDPTVGFAELIYDGKVAFPKTNMTTQFAGMTQYLKQGLYRNNVIVPTGIVYHDGFTIGETLADVQGAPTSPPAGGNSSGSGGPDAGVGVLDGQSNGGTPSGDSSGSPSPKSSGGTAGGGPAVGCSSALGGPAPMSAVLLLFSLAIGLRLWRRNRQRLTAPPRRR